MVGLEVSGLLQRANGPPSVQVLSADHLHTPCHLRLAPVHPCPPLAHLSLMQVRNRPSPLVPLAGQLANGQTQAPWPKQSPPGAPQGGVAAPRRVCVTHSHFWAKIVTLDSPRPHSHFWAKIVTPSSPPVHPPPTYDAHLVNRGKQRLRKGVHRVSGCWSLGLGVSRPKPIGDYGYLWILILIHIRPNP